MNGKVLLAGLVLVLAAVLIAVGPSGTQAHQESEEEEPAHGRLGMMPGEAPETVCPMAEMMRTAMRPPNPYAHILANAEKLGLTDDQKEELAAKARDHDLRLVDLRAAVEKAEIRLDSLTRAKEVDLASVRKVLDELARARADVEFAQIEAGVSAKKLLKREQLETLEQEPAMPMAPGMMRGMMPGMMGMMGGVRGPREREQHEQHH